jgi:chitodextrinase
MLYNKENMKLSSRNLLVSCLVATFASTVILCADAQTTVTGPTTPANIYAALLQSHQVQISWSPSTDNGSTINGYYLYRNGTKIETIPGYTYYTDAPGGGSFSYTVTSYDQAGNISPQSAATPFIAVPFDAIPPSEPANFIATVSSSSVTLSWQPSTDNIAVIGYYLARNGVRIVTASPITGTSYTDTGLTSGTTYNYSVVAYDASSNNSDANSLQATTIFDITPPTAPQGLTATVTSTRSVALNWHPSTDNIQVTGYTIYRNGAVVGNVASTTYTDNNTSFQSSYTYSVTAFDEVGNTSGQSTPVAITTPAPDTTAPSVPQNIAATSLSPSVINVTWSPSTDNVGVAGYYVYRNGSQIATIASTSYTDVGLATDTTYEYAVNAYDSSGNMSAKTSVAATTLSFIPAPTLPPVTQPITPAVIPPPPAITPPTPTPSPVAFTFTTNMYFGMRSSLVSELQSFLIAHQYLGASYGTGYFGSLTQQAVKQFQCAKNIVCSGSPATTGWGSVGPHTRAVLNSF